MAMNKTVVWDIFLGVFCFFVLIRIGIYFLVKFGVVHYFAYALYFLMLWGIIRWVLKDWHKDKREQRETEKLIKEVEARINR